MCLGIPGQIVEIYEQDGLSMGRVDFNGVQRAACLAYVPEAKVGDYVIVHVGFAISVLSEEEAADIVATLREIESLGDEAEER